MGAGSYHWSVTECNGTVWFAKADDLGADEAARQDVFDRLRRSFATALALHRDAGLEVVVPPMPATDGAVLRRLTPRYALSAFPMLDGTAGDFGPHRRADLAEMVYLLAEVHRATPVVAHLAPRADLRLPGRNRLHEALCEISRPWTGGPHAEPARHLLARHAGRVQRWLADFDRLVGAVRATAPGWVVTHGEPHPGNVIRTPRGPRLLDWATVQIAPPERDLWLLTTAFASLIGVGQAGDDDEVLARYAQATGRSVHPAGIALFRRWWALADVAAFIDDLRRPHGDGEDPAAALACLTGYLETATD
ncbi:phosphotransferase [Micromonospora sp. KC721]|nr:phosphotransferase [Micromonospora sp. KC721]